MNAKSATVLLISLAAALSIGACGSPAPTPTVQPAPIAAQDGTKVALPANASPNASSNQQDAYAVKLLTAQNLSISYAVQAHEACQQMDKEVAPLAVVASLTREGLSVEEAAQTVYIGTLAYCPQYRAAFDNLAALSHGGSVTAPTTMATVPDSADEQHAWGCKQGYIKDGC